MRKTAFNRRAKTRPGSQDFTQTAAKLAAIGRNFYSRGWALGTSGNFSAVLSESPLLLAITGSGLDKGLLCPDQILTVDADGTVIREESQQGRARSVANVPLLRPSDETRLHLVVVHVRGAGAVLHTHSVWGTLLSEKFAGDGGVSIAGYEMLKGLQGVRTHEYRAWLPILENSQHMKPLARLVQNTLAQYPKAYGFLLRGHGLYTWGEDLEQAKRHVEILEFLMEVTGRREGAGE
jgi:methylthioribulose-1-phosphate dehydratase